MHNIKYINLKERASMTEIFHQPVSLYFIMPALVAKELTTDGILLSFKEAEISAVTLANNT